MPHSESRTALISLAATTVIATAWSAVGTHDFAVWCFELLPAICGVAGLMVLARWFRFSNIVYYVVSAAFVMMATGAKYTYSEVPIGHWLKDTLDLSRNHFDRCGHFVQGLTVALMAREILTRTTRLCCSFAAGALAVCVAFSFSAFYELVEWWCVIVFYPEAGPEWLGLQGDPWDAQWDMSMALFGAVVSSVLLSRLHDRSMRAFVPSSKNWRDIS